MSARHDPIPDPQPEPGGRALPDYLPARMINEFVYCPRLFYYEQVEGLFAHSSDTVEGAAQHKRVDKQGKDLPPAEEIEDQEIRTTSLMLASDRYRVIAKMDLLEVSGGAVTPVDYKHGRPRETGQGIELWPTDRVQLAVQGLILRDNGYRSDEGLVFYQKTRQRVRVEFTDELIAETLETIGRAWETAASEHIPPPLVDSPKCTRCSLVGICLPEETHHLSAERAAPAPQLSLFDAAHNGRLKKQPGRETRLLVTPRTDSRPLYLNSQGLSVGKTGAVLRIKDKDTVRQDVRIGELCQVNLMGNIQMSTQAVQELCSSEVPICYFSRGGWFYGITTGLNTKNIFLRRAQFRLAEQDWFCLRLARRLTAGKIRNQRTMILRNHVEPDKRVLREMKEMAGRAERGDSLDELLGIEGNAARLYFGAFAGMVKVEPEETGASAFSFDFQTRNRRPPRDAVNALLSLGYSLLTKDFTIACYAVGFDPLMGFYHQPRHGRPALALDLMEPFRPLVVDSAVVSAVNTKMVTPKDFIRAGRAVALTADGRKAFFRAYELRMDTLVTHPLFDYRVSYRRLIEIQTRLLTRYIEGEIEDYPVFVTR